jgi:hypothetical protein
MILEDPVVMGVLGAWAAALEYPGPMTLATVLTGIGWWLARRAS